MSRLRKFHFVIHNQGAYDSSKKDELLEYLRSKYGKALEGYLIAQEMYKDNKNDSHLQGNLFFVNALHFQSLLKFLKTKYKEVKTDLGLNGRIDLSAVLHEGRAYNYMINPSKEGGDRCPICDSTALDGRRSTELFVKDLQNLMSNVHLLTEDIKFRRKVWPADMIGDAPKYVPAPLDWTKAHLI